jgi:kumamolisin
MKSKKGIAKKTAQPMHHVTMIVRHGEGDAKTEEHLFSAIHQRKPKPASDDKDLKQVTDFLRARQIEVVEASANKRTVIARGTRKVLKRVFAPRGKHVPPAELQEIVHEVIGPSIRPRAALGHKVAATIGKFADPRAVAAHYKFPPRLEGHNQCIGLVVLGGGFHKKDLESYFERLGLKTPQIDVVETTDARNKPSSKKDIAEFIKSSHQHRKPKLTAAKYRNVHWTWETTQDIQLLGTFANKARIVVYFGTDDPQGRYNALSSAIFDDEFAPSVVCCSWHIGLEQGEQAVSDDERNRLDALFERASHHHVTVCFASGDGGDGTKGLTPAKKPGVCYPASNPHVLACGGTELVLEPKEKESETVWSESGGTLSMASGGGISRLFETPWWQNRKEILKKTHYPGRGVPDVAAKANMFGGYLGILGGLEIPNGGTSASTPLWASLIAILNQALGTRLGFVNPLLYRDEIKDALHDIVRGNNGKYHASKGWDPCTGLGTPDTAEIIVKLRQLAESAKPRGLAARPT